MTLEEFVNKEIGIWGIDYVDELFTKGYEPVLLTDENDTLRWSWLLTKTPVSSSLTASINN